MRLQSRGRFEALCLVTKRKLNSFRAGFGYTEQKVPLKRTASSLDLNRACRCGQLQDSRK